MALPWIEQDCTAAFWMVHLLEPDGWSTVVMLTGRDSPGTSLQLVSSSTPGISWRSRSLLPLRSTPGNAMPAIAKQQWFQSLCTSIRAVLSSFFESVGTAKLWISKDYLLHSIVQWAKDWRNPKTNRKQFWCVRDGATGPVYSVRPHIPPWVLRLVQSSSPPADHVPAGMYTEKGWGFEWSSVHHLSHACRPPLCWLSLATSMSGSINKCIHTVQIQTVSNTIILFFFFIVI